jgi:hypothetical protein
MPAHGGQRCSSVAQENAAEVIAQTVLLPKDGRGKLDRPMPAHLSARGLGGSGGPMWRTYLVNVRLHGCQGQDRHALRQARLQRRGEQR